MDVSLFDFELPEAQIALRPACPRDSARLMVVDGDGAIAHRFIRDLPDLLQAGDALLLNDTKVIPARLHGQRLRDDLAAKVEILLHRRLDEDRFSVDGDGVFGQIGGDHAGTPVLMDVMAGGAGSGCPDWLAA